MIYHIMLDYVTGLRILHEDGRVQVWGHVQASRLDGQSYYTTYSTVYIKLYIYMYLACTYTILCIYNYNY